MTKTESTEEDRRRYSDYNKLRWLTKQKNFIIGTSIVFAFKLKADY